MRFGIEADTAEVDAVISRLLQAIDPQRVATFATHKAKKQVKEKYAERFRSQTDYGSGWQMAKREAHAGDPKGFPLGPEPGFLTGTTYRSITAMINGGEGRVFPAGIWPQGSGKVYSMSGMQDVIAADGGDDELSVDSLTLSACFKWSTSSGLEFKFWSGWPAYKGPERMVNKVYGREDRPIQWMYLDDDDAKQVAGVIDRMLRYTAQNNIPALVSLAKEVFEDPKEHVPGYVEEVKATPLERAETFSEVEDTYIDDIINEQIRDLMDSGLSQEAIDEQVRQLRELYRKK